MTRQNVTDGPREILTDALSRLRGQRHRRLGGDVRGRGRAQAPPAGGLVARRRPSWSSFRRRSRGFSSAPPAPGSRSSRARRASCSRSRRSDDLPADHFAVLAARARPRRSSRRRCPSRRTTSSTLRLDERASTASRGRDRTARRLRRLGRGAAGRVGETVRARIERATRTVAYAVVASPRGGRGPGRGRASVAEEADAEAPSRGEAEDPARRRAAAALARSRPPPRPTRRRGAGSEPDRPRSRDARSGSRRASDG